MTNCSPATLNVCTLLRPLSWPLCTALYQRYHYTSISPLKFIPTNDDILVQGLRRSSTAHRICSKSIPQGSALDMLSAPVSHGYCKFLSHPKCLLAHWSPSRDYKVMKIEVILPFNYPLAECLTHSRHQLRLDELMKKSESGVIGCLEASGLLLS